MFQRSANPIWYEFNLTGQIFDDTYWAFFQQNTAPYNPQAVYHTPNGTPWSNPIQFGANGGLSPDLYFDPTLVYRIQFRKGPTSADPLIYEIDNYVPGGSGTPSPSTTPAITSENLITNPQFADIYFASPFNITVAGTYPIAPGWNLVLTGAGTATVTRNTYAGNNQIFGNPPYALQIVTNGFTGAQLVQRFDNNGAIFGGAASTTGGVTFVMSALVGGGDEIITAQYVPSTGSARNICLAIVSGGSFVAYPGFNDMTPSNNADSGTAAHVDITINLRGTGDITITNVQLTGQSAPLPGTFSNADVPSFQEQTYERIVDHEFHVYKNALVNQPQDSILAGWNFPLNPWHFWPVAGANVATNAYTADQTIMIQQAYVASATGNNVNVQQSDAPSNHAYQVNAVTAHNQFAILQYIDPATCRPYWNSNVSSMVFAYLNSMHSTTVTFKMRLIYIAGLPSSTSQVYPIASWAEGADPVFAAGVTAIAPPNDPIYTLTTTPTFFPFNNMTLPSSSNANMTLGILIYTTQNMNQTATADFALIQDVSLVPNSFAKPTQAQTFEQALRKCQFYYEYSWNQFTVIGTATSVSSYSAQPSSGTASMYGLNTPFKATKRANPTMVWYSPSTGTAARIYNLTQTADFTVSSTSNAGTTTSGFPVLSAPVNADDGVIAHWTADSRIGL